MLFRAGQDEVWLLDEDGIIPAEEAEIEQRLVLDTLENMDSRGAELTLEDMRNQATVCFANVTSRNHHRHELCALWMCNSMFATSCVS